jgi:hypothetical protein
MFNIYSTVVTICTTTSGYRNQCSELDDSGFEPRQRLEIFLSSEMSRPALGPTQTPIQGVPEFFPGGKAVGA